MNKHLIISILALLCLAACRSQQATPPTANSTTINLQTNSSNTLLDNNKNDILQIDTLSFDKQYGNCAAEEPCVSIKTKTLNVTKGTTASALQNINVALQLAVAAFLNNGEEKAANKPIAELAEALHQDFEKNGKEFGMSWDFDITSSVAMNQNNLLSTQISSMTYTGGAHPSHNNTLQTFDISNGNRITLSDILVPTYQPRLTQIIENNIRKQYEIPPSKALKEHGFIEETINPSDNFMLTPTGITFHYNPYEIAPYVMGHIVVEIPFADIAELIKPNSPASTLLH